MEIIRLHFGASISDNVEFRRKQALLEEGEEGGEGLQIRVADGSGSGKRRR